MKRVFLLAVVCLYATMLVSQEKTGGHSQVLSQEKTRENSHGVVLQQEKTGGHSQEVVLQQEKTGGHSQVLSQEKTGENSHGVVLQQGKTGGHSQEAVLQQEKTGGHSQVLSQEKTGENSHGVVLQQGKTGGHSQEAVLQQEKTGGYAPEMVLSQEMTGGKSQGVVLPQQKTATPLSVSFGSISFFRNHEYFNQITEGYTLSGSHLKPLLIWSPAQNIKVRGGMFVSLWSGYEGSPAIKPVFSVSLDIDSRTRLTVGSLEGPDRHRLFDPHYAKEKIYTSFVEEGVQLVFESNNLFSDTWIDWERHVFWGDSFREEFTVGESFIIKTGRAGDPVRLEIPLQMLVKHLGGQISSYTAPVETHVNLAGGARIALNSGENGDGGSGISAKAFFYHNMKELPDIPFRSGQALLLAGDHTWKDLYLSAGLWMSENFYSPNGNMMYSSLSDYRDGFTLSKRVLLTGSVNFNRSWHAGLLNLLLGFDWYYDVKEKNFDHTLTLHLRIPEKAYGLSRRNQ